MIKFPKDASKLKTGDKPVVLCAPLSFYKKGWHLKYFDKKVSSLFDGDIKKAKPGKQNVVWTRHHPKTVQPITLIALREQLGRSNSPVRKNEIFETLSRSIKGPQSHVLIGVEDGSYAAGCVAAVARTQKVYSRKKGAKTPTIHLSFSTKDASPCPLTPWEKSFASSVPWTCELVDTPPADLNPKTFSEALKERFASRDGVKFTEIKGKKLLAEGFGGAHAVGRTAPEEPRAVILEYGTKKSGPTVVLCGKGVTYDTGGLNLKISGHMSDMKCDMGGAAAVVGAFDVLTQSKVSSLHLVAIVGLVENAIGPDSYRPDDILDMHSGKTVEINNTDAEGRLVLADCLSYACRKYKPALALDAATLTGAQLIATGIYHASFVTNDDEVDQMAHKAAKASGDLICSLPFAPEFFQQEFDSEVADMRNSVKNRMNAQTSCAGQFIYSHIDDCNVRWGHIDLAGPSFLGSRGTGYGVGLMAQMVKTFVAGY